MKKIFICLTIFSSLTVLAQGNTPETSKSKDHFQIGLQVSRSLVGTGAGFTPGLNFRYNVISAGIARFNIGLTTELLAATPASNNVSFIFNPGITTEFEVFKIPLRPYIGLGYAFYNRKYAFNNYYDPEFPSETTIHYKGYSINPGVRYYFKKAFVELGYNVLRFDVSDNFYDSKINHITIGVGASF